MKNEHLNKVFTAAYWRTMWRLSLRMMQTWKFWEELVLMTLGMFLSAAAVYYFLMPSHLIIGTISGLSIVINTVFGGNADTLSYWIMGINAFLLILAFILIGNEFGAKTVYTAMIIGPLIQFWDHVFPYTNLTHQVVNDPDILSQLQAGMQVLDAHGNPYLLSRGGEVLMQIKDSVMSAGLGMGDLWFDLLCFVFVLSLSQAFEFRLNASTGGLDILAKIISKYLHFDMGASVSIGGAIICCSAFAINDFRMVVIGLIGTWINGLVIDYFTTSMNNRKRVCIVSPEYERIRKYIIETAGRGCSLYTIEGGYTGAKQVEIQSLLTKDEYAGLMKFMSDRKIDAFTTVGNCSEIHGTWLIHKSRYADFVADLRVRRAEFEERRKVYMEARRAEYEARKAEYEARKVEYEARREARKKQKEKK